jgi:hypothetical protein
VRSCAVLCRAGPPQTYWCDPPGKYTPEFRAERFRLPYAFAPFRPVVSDVRLASADPATPAPATMPVLGYGQDIAITYRYSGEDCSISGLQAKHD